MTRRQVLANHLGEGRLGSTGQSLEPSRATEHASRDLGGQVVFRLEVTIEAAVRQAGLLHDVGNADAIESPLAKKRPSYVQNPLAMSRRLLARHSHGALLWRNHLTLYMMCVI